jgi:hypothetical protein
MAILPSGEPLPGAVRVDPVDGTSFGVAFMRVRPTVSGPAIGSMIAGQASILIALVVVCFGVSTKSGVAIGGAFAVLASLMGGGAIGLALVALRQIRRGEGRVTGRGMAVAGIACGASGLVLTGLAMLVAVLVASGSGA